MTTKEWRDEMVLWLEGFAWVWFCTLTFRPGLTAPQARWRLRRWLADLREALGTPDFGFFAAREYGGTAQDLHFHVLVTGLRETDAAARFTWMRNWLQFSGDARITPYGGVAGIYYILKQVGPNNPELVEFDLTASAQMRATLAKK